MMKIAKVYIEVPVSERLPEKEGETIFFVDTDNIHYVGWYRDGGFYAFNGQKDVLPVYWLEPVEVPKHEEIETGKGFMKNEMFVIGYNRAVNWILQKLKINQK